MVKWKRCTKLQLLKLSSFTLLPCILRVTGWGVNNCLPNEYSFDIKHSSAIKAESILWSIFFLVEIILARALPARHSASFTGGWGWKSSRSSIYSNRQVCVLVVSFFFLLSLLFLPKRSGGYSPLISQLKFCCHQFFAKGIITKHHSTVPILDSCLLIPRGT